MFHEYYKIYRTGFDSFNIEITYMTYDMGMNVIKTINFDLDEHNLEKMQDMLDSLGFDDKSDDTNNEGENE